MADKGDGTLELVHTIERLIELSSVSIPIETGDAARILIADSVICAVAARSMARTRMSVAALEPGGKPEAEVVTQVKRVRSIDAAWINAEAMNLMDADDTFLNGGHFGSIVSASALAEAQAFGATWERLQTAVTVGFDVLARIQLAAAPTHRTLLAPGMHMIGATVAAAMARPAHGSVIDAAGLAMRSALAPSSRQHALGGFDTFKYAPHGILASQSVLASRLAHAGYRARPWASPGPGLFDTQSEDVDVDALEEGVGETWWVERTSLKPYPSFRLGHPAMDALQNVITEHNVDPEAIERITVFVDPRATRMPFYPTTPDRFPTGPLAPLHAAMHLRYGLALVAMRVRPGPAWSADPAVTSASVWDLANRIEIAGPARPVEWLDAHRDARTGRVHELISRVEVAAYGERYEAEVDMANGDPWRASTRPDWTWLAAKARNFGVAESIVKRIRDVNSADIVGAILAP